MDATAQRPLPLPDIHGKTRSSALLLALILLVAGAGEARAQLSVAFTTAYLFQDFQATPGVDRDFDQWALGGSAHLARPDALGGWARLLVSQGKNAGDRNTRTMIDGGLLLPLPLPFREAGPRVSAHVGLRYEHQWSELGVPSGAGRLDDEFVWVAPVIGLGIAAPLGERATPRASFSVYPFAGARVEFNDSLGGPTPTKGEETENDFGGWGAELGVTYDLGAAGGVALDVSSSYEEIVWFDEIRRTATTRTSLLLVF